MKVGETFVSACFGYRAYRYPRLEGWTRGIEIIENLLEDVNDYFTNRILNGDCIPDKCDLDQ